MTCCKDRFCSVSCKTEAVNTYHKALCGRDLSWLYDKCKDADPISNSMIPLIMVKILAAAVQSNAKPLKIASVGTLQPNYGNHFLSYFRMFDNIVAPMRILQTLGVNIFTDMKFDTWAIQTLFLRIEINKQGFQAGKRTHCGINPLFRFVLGNFLNY